MNLSDVELQIVSKYLEYKDVNELLKINDDLKYMYHSTFEFINIPADYIMPIHQVKRIINNLKSMFPNLEEIILNFTWDYNYIGIGKFLIILIFMIIQNSK